jgi:hypothetical protein
MNARGSATLSIDDGLIELALRALATFFATIGPVDVAAFYAVRA